MPAPIAAVGAAAAGAAVVATLTLSPAGVSLTLCAKILAAAIASLRVRQVLSDPGSSKDGPPGCLPE